MFRGPGSILLRCVGGATLACLLVLFAAPGAGSGFSLIGPPLSLDGSGVGYQRDLRIFNNSADAAANNNTILDANFPGTVGAPQAVWKGAAAWNSTNPNAAKNFDMDWQGVANGSGSPTANIVSWGNSGSCGGGVLAWAASSPLHNGWRIVFCDNHTWADGPGSISGGQYDIQSVMAHEYGHVLGLGHSNMNCACGGNTATMCPFTCSGAEAQRTIEADDAAGLATLYGEIPSNKLVVSSVSGSQAVGGTLTVHGSNFPATVNVKFTARTSIDTAIPGVVYGAATEGNGTRVTVEIPPQALTGNLLVWKPNARLSNALPIEIEPVGLWNDLAGGTQGVSGVPDLTLSGPLTAGSTLSVDLVDGAPSALAALFISFTSTPVDFVGGRLHTVPIDELVIVATDGSGELHGAVPFPAAPAGFQLWMQVAIVDAAAQPHGISLSNAMRGTVP